MTWLPSYAENPLESVLPFAKLCLNQLYRCNSLLTCARRLQFIHNEWDLVRTYGRFKTDQFGYNMQ